MKLARLLFLCGIWCCLASPLLAQVIDSTSKSNDSINAIILSHYQQRIDEIEKQRILDSIHRAELEEKLNSIATSDNRQKEALQRQLDQLNQKEAQRIALKKAQIDSLRSTAIGHVVAGFFDDTLFVIYSKLGSFTASERAAVVEARIKKLPGTLKFHKDSLKIIDGEGTADIVLDDKVIMSVSENDALWCDTNRVALAERYKQIIGDAVKEYQDETSFTVLLKEIGLALLVLLVIALLIIYIGKFFRWTAKKIIDQKDKRIRGITIKSYVLFDARKQIQILLGVNNVVKWIFILLTIYFALPILFGIFPWTENFASLLLGYILSPIKSIALGVWNYLPNLITIIIVVIIFRYVLKLLHFLRDEVASERLHLTGFYPDWAYPTFQIVRVLILAFMIVVIYPFLPGSESPVFKGVSVFLGFLLTFGSAGSLSNIIAGFVLIYMRLFKIGDRVKVGDVTGDVIERSLLVTRVRTIKNEIISIPNSTVMNSHTINYSSDAPERGLIVHTTVTIGYDVPWRKMNEALIEAARKTAGIEKEPEPFVLQTGLEDFYVSYQINAYTRQPNKQATIYSDLHQNIQDTCNERGIEILSPHYRAARDGNASTIPEEYLDKDYQPPVFNININNGKPGKKS